jgi:hypothetical protein
MVYKLDSGIELIRDDERLEFNLRLRMVEPLLDPQAVVVKLPANLRRELIALEKREGKDRFLAVCQVYGKLYRRANEIVWSISQAPTSHLRIELLDQVTALFEQASRQISNQSQKAWSDWSLAQKS